MRIFKIDTDTSQVPAEMRPFLLELKRLISGCEIKALKKAVVQLLKFIWAPVGAGRAQTNQPRHRAVVSRSPGLKPGGAPTPLHPRRVQSWGKKNRASLLNCFQTT